MLFLYQFYFGTQRQDSRNTQNFLHPLCYTNQPELCLCNQHILHCHPLLRTVSTPDIFWLTFVGPSGLMAKPNSELGQMKPINNRAGWDLVCRGNSAISQIQLDQQAKSGNQLNWNPTHLLNRSGMSTQSQP